MSKLSLILLYSSDRTRSVNKEDLSVIEYGQVPIGEKNTVLGGGEESRKQDECRKGERIVCSSRTVSK